MNGSDAAIYWSSLSWGAVLLNIMPFAGLLALIAILPLVKSTAQWWDSLRNKALVAAVCAVSGVALYVLPTGDGGRVLETALDYGAFLALLTSLFVISGGIHVSGSFAGFPSTNTALLALGAILANLLGTTGASMLLIRPLLHANRKRSHKAHIVVFFIFIVSNCGGLLTPLGDPPLYLGFLRGVPFDWTLRLGKEWAFTNGILLVLFNFLDEWFFEKEELSTKGFLAADVAASQRLLHLQGKRNLALLGGVMGCILLSGYVVTPLFSGWWGAAEAATASKLFQVSVLGLLAWISWKATPKHIHELNHFGFGPILEVAVLFFGIFGAMLPALALLEGKGPSLPLTQSWHYFWASGFLSSFLDNAPTYLTFVTMASAHLGLSPEHLGALAQKGVEFLAAVSCGSVFMGANTYIGNGPNFMVKSIAEHSGVKMPSFGGYMLWSCGILIPLFILETFLFF
jgi:Na+/H+ antiporter NhaD/arsenite permease-like protein